MKRILAISNYGAFLGGGEKSFFDLVTRLPEPWDILTAVPEEGELADSLRQNGIKTEVIPLSAVRPWYAHNVTLSLKNYFNLFRKYRPALIYANGSRSALYGGIIGRVLKIPVIWHCRIAEPDICLDPLICRMSCRIIANSQATARRFKPSFQHKVRTIYNGIDIRWLQDSAVKCPDLIQSDWKVLIVVARVSKSKRHDLALSAFKKIAASDPKLHLVCVGAEDAQEPGLYGSLMLRTKQSLFSNRIHWIGQVTDVRSWYKSASVLLFPAENEAFGRVLIEAMACRVPVVATRSGGIPEIITDGKNGLLVSAGDADWMADAVSQIISNSSLRDILIQNGITRANNFNLETHVEKMMEVFEDTILK